MKTTFYPWQREQWQRLQLAKAENRLPHAIMLTGIAGIGKRVFADALARSLLCTNHPVLRPLDGLRAQDGHLTHPEGDHLTHPEELPQAASRRAGLDQAPEGSAAGYPCDCHACRLVMGRSHPDAHWVEPEKEGQAIKVDQVREVNHFIQQSSLGEMNRVVIIYPADAMNINAANALLKTLEEPSSKAFIILICDQAGRLPATILSRCQRVHFARPSKEEATAWLQKTSLQAGQQADLLLRLTHGAPCAAKGLADDDGLILRQHIISQLSGLCQGVFDPLQVAGNIKEADYVVFIEIMMSWLLDVIKLQLNADTDNVMNIDHVSALEALKSKTDINHHLKTTAALQKLQQATQTGLNLNKKLMMENILINWAAELRV